MAIFTIQKTKFDSFYCFGSQNFFDCDISLFTASQYNVIHDLLQTHAELHYHWGISYSQRHDNSLGLNQFEYN